MIVQRKVFTHKLEHYFKAIQCLQDIDIHIEKPQNIYNINSTLFWYKISAEYYYFDYIPKHRKQEVK